MERKLFVQQNGKSVDALFEFSGRMRSHGMVHNAYPELCQGLIIGATSSFGARVLPYPEGKKRQRLLKGTCSQNEPGESKMTTMPEIFRGQRRLMERPEKFLIVHSSR
jgi:hypothetical protein